jgi:hypothetical protein
MLLDFVLAGAIVAIVAAFLGVLALGRSMLKAFISDTEETT